jgi:hypothetical protein
MSYRKQKIITLGDTVSVKILEISPAEIKNAIELIMGFVSGGEVVVDWGQMLTSKWPDILDKLSMLIVVDGCQYEEIGYSAQKKIYEAFMEVNADFFADIPKILRALGLGINLAAIGGASNETSTAPASPSLSEGTETSSATAGVSS